jgi:hypothetical protein
LLLAGCSIVAGLGVDATLDAGAEAGVAEDAGVDVPSSCGLPPSPNATCNQCANANCCQVSQLCSTQDACAEGINCLVDCTFNVPCVNACLARYGDATALGQVYQCSIDSCLTKCVAPLVCQQLGGCCQRIPRDTPQRIICHNTVWRFDETACTNTAIELGVYCDASAPD